MKRPRMPLSIRLWSLVGLHVSAQFIESFVNPALRAENSQIVVSKSRKEMFALSGAASSNLSALKIRDFVADRSLNIFTI
jgi:hypothetical protein